MIFPGVAVPDVRRPPLDPVSYVSRPPFQYTTASVPAVVVAGLVYWLGVTAVLRPLGRGGYDGRVPVVPGKG